MVIINPTSQTQPAAFNRPAGPAPIIPTDKVLIATVLSQRANHLYELASGNLRLMAESQTALRNGEQLTLQFHGRDAQHRIRMKVLPPAQTAITQQLGIAMPKQRPITQALASLVTLAQSNSTSPVNDAAKEFLSRLPDREQVSHPQTLLAALKNSGMFLESQLLAGNVAQGDLKTALLRLARQLEQHSKTPASTSQDKAPFQRTENNDLKPGQQLLNKPLPSTSLQLRIDNTYTAPTRNTLTTTFSSGGQQPLTKAYPVTTGNPDLPGTLQSLPRQAQAVNSLAITANPARLLQDINGALARIESHQLLHLQNRESQLSPLLIELPVRDKDGIDLWQLRLQSFEQPHPEPDKDHPHDPAKKNSERHWQFTLNVDLPGLGAIRAQLQMRGEALTLNVNIANPNTHALFSSNRNELIDRLVAQGLEAPELEINLGSLSSEPPQGLQNLRFVKVTA